MPTTTIMNGIPVTRWNGMNDEPQNFFPKNERIAMKIMRWDFNAKSSSLTFSFSYKYTTSG